MSENRRKVVRLVTAMQPEMCRVNQKDEEYVGLTYQKLLNALEICIPSFFSYQNISRNTDSIKLLSALVYYGLSLIDGNQTLGDEFSSLFMVSFKDWTYEALLMKMSRKLLMIFLMTIPQFILTKVFAKKLSAMKEKVLQLKKKEQAKLINIIIRNAPDMNELMNRAWKIHLAFFFVQGTFLQISKRVSGVKYVYAKKPRPHSTHYKNIGIMMLVQIMIETFEFLYKIYKDHTNYSKISEEEEDSAEDELELGRNKASLGSENQANNLCNLCYDERKAPSSTPCGHIFCWDCIIKACIIKPECPSCRAPCLPRKVVLLRNFF